MNDMSLKAKIRNISKEKNISAFAVLQNYLMSHFLYRLFPEYDKWHKWLKDNGGNIMGRVKRGISREQPVPNELYRYNFFGKDQG